MPSRHVARGRRRAPRRKLIWCTTNLALTGTSAGHVTNVDLLADLAVAGASRLGSTIMRTHVSLSNSSAVAAGNDFYFGLLVGRNNDLETDLVPAVHTLNVATQPELDWMFWKHYVAAPTFDAGGSNIIDLDVKSKRKLEELDQTYLACVGFGVAAGNVSLQLVARTLVALP